MDEDTHTILLAYNKIGTLKSLSFHRNQLVEHLELQNNIITTIHNQAFQYLQNLSYLDLSSNQLTNIKVNILTPLSKLTTLNLANNKITRLSGSMLQPPVYLQALYLHNNALKQLKVDLLYSLTSLTHLRLDGNPWVCTCQIEDLWNWMVDNPQKVQEKNRTLCDVPKYLDQSPVLLIERNSFQYCQEYFTLFEYLFFLLIGISLFLTSIFLCLALGSLTICYERFIRWKARRPHVYKKRTVQKRESVLNGHQIPVCKV
ncbi:leucine-rich repeat-containing protein 26 [Rhinophrynus dorsalis]